MRYNRKLLDKEAEKKLEGHAWLLYNGDIFLEKNPEGGIKCLAKNEAIEDRK